MPRTRRSLAKVRRVPDRVIEPRPSRSRRADPLLLEIAWEACNQLGGIYTVLRSKAPTMVDRWGGRYCLIGPYNHATASVEFEPAPLAGPFGQAVKQLREEGVYAHYGRWLVTGRPHVVLLEYLGVFDYLHEVKYRLWQDHEIATPDADELINNVVAFAEVCRRYLQILGHAELSRRRIVAHFHEWMSGATIPMLKKEDWGGSLVFTTHATQLGRFLAMNDGYFYDHLSHYDHQRESSRFNVQPQHRIERAASHGAHVFTTVSDVTAAECRHLLGRNVDIVLPNGLNIQRFAVHHEFQNLHRQYKQQIHRFTMGHFFPSYHFDLDKTLYFFTAGRYEVRNKGMDLTIEALARLNHLLGHTGSDMTVVAFIITQRPVRSINVTALQSKAMLEELHTVAEAIKDQIGDRLFKAAATGKIPDMNSLVDEYWRLRMRRTIHTWKRDMPPGITTHDQVDDSHDDILNQLRSCQLWNQEYNRVKVVYHPGFITPTNPLFGMDYDQFVRGCHLGIFPSYYEPWGYTPLESMALGVPAITSDLAGFGSYVSQMLPDHEEKGMYVLKRRDRSFDQSASQLAQHMLAYTQLDQRQRISLRNGVESFSVHFDWSNLGEMYHQAHELALDRVG